MASHSPERVKPLGFSLLFYYDAILSLYYHNMPIALLGLCLSTTVTGNTWEM